MNKQSQALALLKFKADPNIAQNEGDTPLHRAVAKRNFSLVKLLLDYGADPNFKNRVYSRTPLHICFISESKTDILFKLVEKGGNLGIKDRRGLRPVDYLEPQMKSLQRALNMLKSQLNKGELYSTKASQNNMNILNTLQSKSSLNRSKDKSIMNSILLDSTIKSDTQSQIEINDLREINQGLGLGEKTFINNYNITIPMNNSYSSRGLGISEINPLNTLNTIRDITIENLRKSDIIIQEEMTPRKNSIAGTSHMSSRNYTYSKTSKFRRNSEEIEDLSIFNNGPKLRDTLNNCSIIHLTDQKVNKKLSFSNESQVVCDDFLKMKKKSKSEVNEKLVQGAVEQLEEEHNNPKPRIKRLRYHNKVRSYGGETKNYLNPESIKEMLLNDHNERLRIDEESRSFNNSEILIEVGNGGKPHRRKKSSKIPPCANEGKDFYYTRPNKYSDFHKLANKQDPSSKRDRTNSNQTKEDSKHQSKCSQNINASTRAASVRYQKVKKVSMLDNVRQNSNNDYVVDTGSNHVYLEDIEGDEDKSNTGIIFNTLDDLVPEQFDHQFDFEDNNDEEEKEEIILNSFRNDTEEHPRSKNSKEILERLHLQSCRLVEWLTELNLQSYFNLFLRSKLLDLDILVERVRRKEFGFDDLKEIGIDKSGHVFRILTKLKIDAGLVDAALAKFIILGPKSVFASKLVTSLPKNSLKFSIEKYTGCCGLGLEDSSAMRKTKICSNSFVPNYELSAWLKKNRLNHLKRNFIHNGFDYFEFFVVMMFIESDTNKNNYHGNPIDEKFLEDYLHIYDLNVSRALLKQLNIEREVILAKFNGMQISIEMESVEQGCNLGCAIF